MIKKYVMYGLLFLLITSSLSARHKNDYTGAIIAGTFASALAALASEGDYYHYRPDYHYYSCRELVDDLVQEIRALKRELRHCKRGVFSRGNGRRRMYRQYYHYY